MHNITQLPLNLTNLSLMSNIKTGITSDINYKTKYINKNAINVSFPTKKNSMLSNNFRLNYKTT